MELKVLGPVFVVRPVFIWVFDRWIYFGGIHANFLIGAGARNQVDEREQQFAALFFVGPPRCK
jgi:hypothetical protein